MFARLGGLCDTPSQTPIAGQTTACQHPRTDFRTHASPQCAHPSPKRAIATRQTCACQTCARRTRRQARSAP